MIQHYSLIFIFIAMSQTAFAENARHYCVSCNNPDKTYLCKIASDKDSTRNPAEKLNCAVNIAKDYHHESCAVKASHLGVCKSMMLSYGNTSDSNIYTLRRNRENNQSIFPQPEGENEVTQPDRYTAPEHRQTPNRTTQDNEEPKTLVDLTNKVIKDTGERLDNTGDKIKDSAERAGDVIGNAARTTFDCVTSFFRKCD